LEESKMPEATFMTVRELKERIESAKDEDKVFVRFPNLGTGGYDTTYEVKVETLKGRLIIIAALL